MIKNASLRPLLLVAALLLAGVLAACRAPASGQSPPELTQATPTIEFVPTDQPPYPEPGALQAAPDPTRGPQPYPGPPTATPDVQLQAPPSTPVATPTDTPKPTVTLSASPTEVPVDYLSPLYSVESFQSVELPLEALWTSDGRAVTAHSSPAITFPLAPKAWELEATATRSFLATRDGSKIAYQFWTSGGGEDIPDGDRVILDDLAAGKRHIYFYPRAEGTGYYIPDLHLSPDEGRLLFLVQRELTWVWMIIDVETGTVAPLALDLAPLADPQLSRVSGQRVNHTSFASLFPVRWTPAGILAQKVLVGTDAPPFGLYSADPGTGAVTLAWEGAGQSLVPAKDGLQVAFSTLSVSPFEVTSGDPFFSEVSLLDLSTGQIQSLLRVENLPTYLNTWTPDGRGLGYVAISPLEWQTAALGLYHVDTGQHQTIDLLGIPDLDPVEANILALGEDRFLVLAYAQDTRQTNLYTLPIDNFTLENLTPVQSIAGRVWILHVPASWPN